MQNSVWNEEEVVPAIRQAFKLTCLLCGSENIGINFERGIDYGGETGYSPGSLSFGCNNCKQNDLDIAI